MDSRSNGHDAECGAIQELIAWYPSRTLQDSERARVEDHAGECSACADLLRFANTFKEKLVELHSLHPTPEALVRYVEDSSAIDLQTRRSIETHLGICAECLEQSDMLKTVDENLPEAGTRNSPSPARPPGPGVRTGLRSFWDWLANGLFGPGPAAAYLAVALLAIGFTVFAPNQRPEGSAPRSLDRDDGLSPVGVVILPDETDRARQVATTGLRPPQIDAENPPLLLIELVNLESPPAGEDLFTVRILRSGLTDPVRTIVLRGKSFSDNYTIGLPLKGGTLTPGRYVIEVLAATGECVFRSTIQVR